MKKNHGLRKQTLLLIMLVLVLLLSGCTGGKKVPKTDLMPFMANATSLWAVDTSGELFRSTDLGHTFARVTPPGWMKPGNQEDASSYAIVRTMYASDAKQAWLVDGEDNLHRTYNGGKSWKNLGKTLPERSYFNGRMQMTFSDALHGWLLAPTGFYSSNDGGSSWEKVNDSGSDEGLSLVFMTNQKGFKGSRDGLYRTDNGGKDWRIVPLGRKGGVLAPQFFDSYNGMLQFADTDKQEYFYFSTRNGGESWEEIIIPQKHQDEFTSSFSLYRKDEGYLVYMGLNSGQDGLGVSRLFHTTDHGQSWTQVELSESVSGFPLFSSPTKGIVFESVMGKDNYSMKETADGGKTWTPFTPLVKE